MTGIMIDSRYQKLIEKLGEKRTNLSELLSQYTSLRIGGPADLFYRAKTIEELTKAVNSAKEYKVPYFILGSGTNILAGDSGFRGLIIRNETRNIRLLGVRGGNKPGGRSDEAKVRLVYLEAESGATVNHLVRFTLEQGFGGFETFLGQPGTIGGAVWINAHNIRFKKYFSDDIYSIKILNKEGIVQELPKNHFHFGYDSSIIQKTKDIVLSVVFKLETRDSKKLWQKAHEIMAYRKETQPQGFFSAGCVFKNISKSDALRLATPNYTCSTGYLIDQLNLKGVSIGNVMFSPDHANFIVHKGSAKASDVVKLIQLAKKRAWEKYGIRLQEEIVFIGDF